MMYFPSIEHRISLFSGNWDGRDRFSLAPPPGYAASFGDMVDDQVESVSFSQFLPWYFAIS